MRMPMGVMVRDRRGGVAAGMALAVAGAGREQRVGVGGERDVGAGGDKGGRSRTWYRGFS